MDWNKPDETCYLTAELLGALVAQDGNLYTRLWNRICPFLTFFFFFPLQVRLIESYYRLEWKRACVCVCVRACVSNDFVH